MFDFVTKVDGGTGDAGELDASEANNYLNELENAVTRSGQTLDATGLNVIQLSQAIAAPGRAVLLNDTDTASFGDRVFPNNLSNSVTINLPINPYPGAIVYFEQHANQSFETQNLTVQTTDGNTINTGAGATTTFLVNTPRTTFHFFYDIEFNYWTFVFDGYTGTSSQDIPDLRGIAVAGGQFNYNIAGTVIIRSEFGVTSYAQASGVDSVFLTAIRITLDRTFASTDDMVVVATGYYDSTFSVNADKPPVLFVNKISATQFDIKSLPTDDAPNSTAGVNGSGDSMRVYWMCYDMGRGT